jgi:hypothetical protein
MTPDHADPSDQNRNHVLMSMQHLDPEQKDPEDRREVRPPIEVESAIWSPSGQLDWWVKERQEWCGRVRGQEVDTGGSVRAILVVPRATDPWLVVVILRTLDARRQSAGDEITQGRARRIRPGFAQNPLRQSSARELRLQRHSQLKARRCGAAWCWRVFDQVRHAGDMPRVGLWSGLRTHRFEAGCWVSGFAQGDPVSPYGSAGPQTNAYFLGTQTVIRLF